MAQTQQKSTLDGLPKEFVSSLKILFDVLDETKCGYVKFTDIASYWEQQRVDGLPPGIVDALKKVTLSNGTLTFERFVAGLKIALLRSRTERAKAAGTQPEKHHHPNHQVRPDLIVDTQTYGREAPHHKNSKSQESVGPRTKSMPHLNWERTHQEDANQLIKPEPHYAWKQPQRGYSDQHNDNGSHRNHGQAWDPHLQQQRRDVQGHPRRPGDGRSSIACPSALDIYSTPQADADSPSKSKRREPRRHTLNNGVDYNMLRRLKQLEAERDVLLAGFEAVKAATDWYKQQLSSVEQRQKYLGQPAAHAEHSVEAHQERVNFQTARILEVNQQLRALIDSSKKGFPLHMHLAVSKSTMERSETEKDNTIAVLKAHNKMLSKEVGEKSESIATLEKEKTHLIKELFQARNHHGDEYDQYDDTTFI